MITIALNGCGRIGKNIIRAIFSDTQAPKLLSLRAINIGPTDPTLLPYMLTYDSLLGTWDVPVRYEHNTLYIADHPITIYTTTDFKKLTWQDIDWVIDATGAATHKAVAELHRTAGARNVLITAPSPDADVTIVPGVNLDAYDAATHHIISLGSCTTNAIVPLLHTLDRAYTIEHATLTTVHAYTNSQELLDVNPTAKNPRSSRAAALNIIPSTTGASQSVTQVLPQLANKLNGISLRVPVPTVSLADIVCTVAQQPTSRDAVNTLFARTAQHDLRNILAYTAEPLVSSDFQGSPYSVTFDSSLTVLQGNQIRIYGWYDNEWGYSCRVRDFLCAIGA